MKLGKEPGEDVFNKKRIAEITGLTERQVQFYTEQGVVTPEKGAGEGRGKTRFYSDHNLGQFMIIKALTDLGMTISKIRPIIGDKKLDTMLQRSAAHQDWPIIKILRQDDGQVTISIKDLAANRSVLDAKEIRDVDECIVINYRRIANAAYRK